MPPRNQQPQQPATQPRPRLTFNTLVPLAQEKALELAAGDKSRVEVISPTEAIVR